MLGGNIGDYSPGPGNGFRMIHIRPEVCAGSKEQAQRCSGTGVVPPTSFLT